MAPRQVRAMREALQKATDEGGSRAGGVRRRVAVVAARVERACGAKRVAKVRRRRHRLRRCQRWWAFDMMTMAWCRAKDTGMEVPRGDSRGGRNGRRGGDGDRVGGEGDEEEAALWG